MNIEEEQDFEEGFFPQQPIITKHSSLKPDQSKPYNYQPRVLRQASIYKKLPFQTNQFVPEIQNLEESQMLQTNLSYIACQLTAKQQAVTAFQKYERDKKHFSLIYSKSGQCPLKDGDDNFAKRQIMLHCAPYSSEDYIQLQNFSAKTSNLSGHKQYIEFDSQFQCGNLLCVYKSLIEQHSYHCFIQNDTNTFGYNQWLYFSIIGARKGLTYKFYIVNMRKKFSFFKMGMKPVVFSLKQHQKHGNGWSRKGTNISYNQSSIYDTRNQGKLKLYCLYFEIQFDQDEDYITLSLGMPYSYSRLIHQLKRIKETAINNDLVWEQKTISYTISNNQVPYLIISKDQEYRIAIPRIKRSEKSFSSASAGKKQIIIILARQHPGQTNSSYLMEQILKILAKNQCPKIKSLLQRYQFRIFPMINVDGVIYGNFRCDLAGFDLNRTWKRPLKEIHPQIYAIKKQIAKLSRSNQIIGFFDLHSHSKQLNIFSYCTTNSDEILSRLFSYMLSKSTPLFWFPYCTFGLFKNKQGTARAVISSAIKRINAITIQSSCFAVKKKDKIIVIQPKHFGQMAASILTTMNSFFTGDKSRHHCKKQIESNIQEMKRNNRESVLEISGSDSQPEADIEDSAIKLKRLLPPKILQIINKRLIQEQQNEIFQNIQLSSKKKMENNSLQHIIQRRKQIQQKELKNTRTLKYILTEPVEQISVSNKKPSLRIKEMRKQIKIQVHPYSIKSRKIMPPKISTQRKNSQRNQQAQVEDLKINRHEYDLVNEQQFKKSMKMLYNQLERDPHEDLTKSIKQRQLSLAFKLPEDRRVNHFKNMTKMQKILKINRKTNIFKSLTKRQGYTCNDSQLLQIYSHAIMPEQSKNHANLYNKLKNQRISPLKVQQQDIFRFNQGYLRGSIAVANKLKNYKIKCRKKTYDNI